MYILEIEMHDTKRESESVEQLHGCVLAVVMRDSKNVNPALHGKQGSGETSWPH
jgi:hypothetical protein